MYTLGLCTVHVHICAHTHRQLDVLANCKLFYVASFIIIIHHMDHFLAVETEVLRVKVAGLKFY